MKKTFAGHGSCHWRDHEAIVVRDPDLVHELFTRTNDDFSSASSAVASRFDARRDSDDAHAWMSARRSGRRGLNRAAATPHTARLRALFERTLDEPRDLLDVLPAAREPRLGEWELRPEDQVMSSPYLLHRDPRWWPDADVLDPDRRLDGRTTPRKHSYVPFGAGPRVCVGTQLGMVQLTPAAFWLTRGHRVSAPDADRSAPEFHDLLVPKGFQAASPGREPVLGLGAVLRACLRAGGRRRGPPPAPR
ncbi:cytochrome P450 [Actinosynnema sp. NPDC059797]